MQVDPCDASLTRANLSASEMSIAHIIKRCTNLPFTLLHRGLHNEIMQWLAVWAF